MCDNKQPVDKDCIKLVENAFQELMKHKGKDGASEDGIIMTFTNEFDENNNI